MRRGVWSVVKDTESEGTPVMVIANKQDLPQARRAPEVAELLGLYELSDRKWTVEETVAKDGTGVVEAFQKLENIIPQ